MSDYIFTMQEQTGLRPASWGDSAFEGDRDPAFDPTCFGSQQHSSAAELRATVYDTVASSLRVWFALLVSLSGCAHGVAVDGPETGPSFADAVSRCTIEAEARNPVAEIHTLGAHVTRGGVVIGVAVDIPQDPSLQECLLQLPRQRVRLPASGVQAPEQSIGVGGFAVDVGQVPEGPRAADEVGTTLARHRERSRKLVEDLVSRGALPADDPLVEEVLAGFAADPTASGAAKPVR